MAKTQVELDAIKAELSGKYKPLWTIVVPFNEDGDEFRTIFLKKFDRVTLSAVQKLATGPDSVRAVEAFIKNTYIGGDDLTEVLANFDALRSLEPVVIELITAKKASISKN